MSLEDFYVICLNNGMTLDEGFALYKLYRYNKFGPPEGLSSDSFQKLLDNKLYVDGKPSPKLYSAFADAEQNFRDGATYEETMKFHEETIRLTSKVRRRETAYIPELDRIIDFMTSTLYDYEMSENGKEAQDYEYAVEFMNYDRELARYYATWYYLFPTSSAVKNEGWNKLFKFTYRKNYQLRTGFKNHIKWFKTQSRKYDMRIFIIGTFLCMKSGLDGNDSYLKKITTFKDEAEDWYMFAIDTIDELGQNIWSIFDAKSAGSFESVNSTAGGNLV